jgi:hypothetical protein
MDANAAPAVPPADPLARERWAGEVRVNLLRLGALAAFYAYHLVNYSVNRDDPGLTVTFHQSVTAVVLAWAGAAVLLHLALARGWWLPALPFAAVLTDAGLTACLLVLGDGPRSPLVSVYFLLIASTPLRLSRAVVVTGTLAAVVGYFLVLGHYAYIRIGADAYYGNPSLRVPRPQQVILVLALVTSGLFAGQSVRQALRLAGTPSTEDADA